jgi:hypothetical protein
MFLALRALFFCIGIPAIIIAVLVFYCTDNHPAISANWQPTSQDIQRAKQIFSTSRLRLRGVKTLTLNEKDLNIATSYILNRFVDSHSKVTLSQTGLNLAFSIKLPENLLGKYLNIRFRLSKHQGFPVIDNLSFGGFAIADELAGLIIENIINFTQLKQYYFLLGRHIRGITIDPEQIQITYLMTPASFIEAQNYLLEHANNNMFAVYQRKLNDVVRIHNPSQRLSLADLLQPLFQLAMQRSTLDNAVAENRAIIFIVSAYVNSREVFKFLSYDLRRRPIIYPVYIYKRTDMAKHFMALAAVTSSGSTHLAHLLGREKEMFDSRQGSGFSFIDLAADRAGMYFGKMATSSPENALKFQQAMANIQNYPAFMPEVRDLPENMNNETFKAQFGSIYSPAYQNLLKKIDIRISACSIYAFRKS